MRHLADLAALISRDKEQLLSRWREQVRHFPSAKALATPALNDHVPALLDELVTELLVASRQTIPQALLEGSPPVHGRQRQKDGFDIVEIVAEYNILRGCIYDLAQANDIRIEGGAFHILNRVLDEAVGLAVQTFATQQALEVQRRREEYLAFVAHDLRTPLDAISLAGQVLEASLAAQDDASGATRILKTHRRNVQQLQALVERVLKESDHIRTESGVRLELRHFDLWPMVEALVQDLHPLAGTANTKLVNEVADDLAAYADASVLKRIFQNLIANAIKFTPRGEVAIGARQVGGNGDLECWVRDNGAGIPADRLESIFEKAEAGQEEAATGFGLSIVKTFVEAHGGTVQVESQVGVGSTFRFTIPGRRTR